jgi:hypothetical protein
LRRYRAPFSRAHVDVEEIMLQTIAFALAALFAGALAAQQPARPDPADPKAAVPAQRYESVFKTYRPYIDPELARWREANEEVRRVGGHVGHVPKAAQQGKPAAKAPAQSAHEVHK